MRDYTPDDKARKILVLAAKGSTQVQMAKEVSISKSAVNQRINSLEKYDYLERKRVGLITIFGLKPLGVMVIAEMARRGICTLNDNSPMQSESLIRLHNIELKWDVLKNPDCCLSILKQERIEYTLSGTKNHSDPIFVYKNYTIIISKISLILRCQETIGKQSDLVKLVCDVFDNANAIALDLEKKFGLKLMRIDKDTIYAHFSKLEIALLDNPLAKVLNNQKGDKIESTNTN